MPRTALLWYRRDLRLHDHPALHAAVGAADRVVPVFVLDPGLLEGRWPAPNRVRFMLGSLAALGTTSRCAARLVPGRPGSPARSRRPSGRAMSSPRGTSPVCPDARRRGGQALDAVGAALHLRGGALVAEPEEIAGADGRTLTVFTPYFRRWQGLARRGVLPVPDGCAASPPMLPVACPASCASGSGQRCPDRGPGAPAMPGEAAARARLAAWATDERLAGYAEGRDRLGMDGTSRLSADLRWGLVSPLAVLTQSTARAADLRRSPASWPGATSTRRCSGTTRT